MSPYFLLEHTADIAYKVMGETPEELFLDAAKAWLNSSSEINSYDNIFTMELFFSGETHEYLLVDFLSELNYLLTTKKILCFDIHELSISKGEEYLLRVILRAMNISEESVTIKEEIKAVTFHQLEIKKTENGFETMIVFDI